MQTPRSPSPSWRCLPAPLVPDAAPQLPLPNLPGQALCSKMPGLVPCRERPSNYSGVFSVLPAPPSSLPLRREATEVGPDCEGLPECPVLWISLAFFLQGLCWIAKQRAPAALARAEISGKRNVEAGWVPPQVWMRSSGRYKRQAPPAQRMAPDASKELCTRSEIRAAPLHVAFPGRS